MFSIQISNLYPLGFELFQDSESFLEDLTDNEIRSIKGGYCILSLERILAILNVQYLEVQAYEENAFQTLISAEINTINNNTYNSQSINNISTVNMSLEI